MHLYAGTTPAPSNFEVLYPAQKLVDGWAPIAETVWARRVHETPFPFLSATTILARYGSGLLRLEPSQVLLIDTSPALSFHLFRGSG